MDARDLIHDWNRDPDASGGFRSGRVELNDETLRDGLQSASAVDASIGDKIRLLHLMDRLGIHAADLGMPGAGRRAVDDVTALAREIVDAGLSIRPNCAARTEISDVRPVVEISQKVGIPAELAVFLGSSPIRLRAEGWTLDRMLHRCEETVGFAVREGLPVMMVTEDSTRSRPDVLTAIYATAIRCGARRVCVSDTVGHATPDGTRALVRFVIEEIVTPSGVDVGVDWHGHRDRGFGLANAMTAIRAGVSRVHGTALGLGERSGNTEMELLLVNLALEGVHQADLTLLPAYCQVVAQAYRMPIPLNAPVVGWDAFRTATGVHAAAIVKAVQKGDVWLADHVYSGVPASLVGRSQHIEIGPLSGLSNVKHWLRVHGRDPDDVPLCHRILRAAKDADHTLSKEELEALCRGA